MIHTPAAVPVGSSSSHLQSRWGSRLGDLRLGSFVAPQLNEMAVCPGESCERRAAAAGALRRRLGGSRESTCRRGVRRALPSAYHLSYWDTRRVRPVPLATAPAGQGPVVEVDQRNVWAARAFRLAGGVRRVHRKQVSSAAGARVHRRPETASPAPGFQGGITRIASAPWDRV